MQKLLPIVYVLCIIGFFCSYGDFIRYWTEFIKIPIYFRTYVIDNLKVLIANCCYCFLFFVGVNKSAPLISVGHIWALVADFVV